MHCENMESSVYAYIYALFYVLVIFVVIFILLIGLVQKVTYRNLAILLIEEEYASEHILSYLIIKIFVLLHQNTTVYF